MLIRHSGIDLVERIVFIDDDYGYCWLINVDLKDKSWPHYIRKTEIAEKIECKEIFIDLDDIWLPNNSEYSNNEDGKKRQDLRYQLIENLVCGENERYLFFKKQRKELIEKQVLEIGSTRQTISNILRLFWKRGMTLEAVQTLHENCGGQGNRHNSNILKMGRPRTISPGIGCNVTEEIRKKFKVGVDHYLFNDKASLKDAFEKLIRLYFSKKIVDENNRISTILVAEDEQPTFRQFYTYCEQDDSYKERIIRRKGQQFYDLNCRQLLGTNTDDVQGPGDRFQVDATIADVYLLSQFDLRRIVGRPVIYFIIDVFSRLITGVYVGFEGPSWIGAMMVLCNMVRNKVDFCQEYEIEINEQDWPCCHAPKAILADRGELKSTRLGENITKRLKINLENASPGRPDLKALVERRFGIVPLKFKQFMPGYVKPDFLERGAPDYRLEATYDLKQFTQLVILAIIEHNKTPIRDLMPPSHMITEGMVPSPLNLWNWGIKNRSGALRTLTEDETKLNVMPPAKAKVTRHGLLYSMAYYTCPTALKEEWFAANSNMQGKYLDISIDPRKMDKFYLRDSGDLKLDKGYEVCKLLPRSFNYTGKSIYEAEENDLRNKINIAYNKPSLMVTCIDSDEAMGKIESNAIKLKSELGKDTRSKAEITKGIKENHAVEKASQRPKEVFELGQDHENYYNNVNRIDINTCNNGKQTDDDDNVLFNPLDILKGI